MTYGTKRSSRGRMAGAALAAALMLGMGTTWTCANVLVSDNFDSAADGAALAGRSPDTGSYAWTVSGTLTITKSAGDGAVYTTDTDGKGGNEGDIQFDAGSFDQYAVSATLNVQDTAYVGMGFINGENFFTDSQVTITLRPNGRVTLIGPYDSVDKSTNLGDVTIANFDAAADHAVKVIYDAAANKASVVVDGSTVIAPVAVTDHNGDPYTPILKYGSFRFQNPTAVAPNSYPRARVDDFQITATPEPGSLALLGLGGLVMLRRRKSQ